MSQRAFLVTLLLAAPAVAASASLLQQEEPVLGDSEHKKLGRLLQACVEAKIAEGKGQLEAENEFVEGLEDWSGERELDDRPALAFPLDIAQAIWHSNEYHKQRGIRKGRVDEHEFTTAYSAGEEHVAAVSAPSRYSARDKHPLVLCIPDAGEEVERYLEERWTAEVEDGAILAAVPMPEDTALWGQVGEKGSPGGGALTLTLLGEIARTYAIDFDRVYLAGHGAGVAAAVELASRFPDRFAGVIGRAGDVGDTSPENFRGVATYFAGGGANATAFAEACEKDGTGNSTVAPEGKESDIWAWMQANPRDPYPTETHLLAGAPFPNKAYWLWLPPTDGSVVNRVHAKIDRATNTVTVDVDGARECLLYFNDVLVDLDQPVKVVINGVEHVDELPRSSRTLLELVYGSGSDPGKVYVASKRYDVPAAEDSE